MLQVERFFLEATDSTNLEAMRVWRSPALQERAVACSRRDCRLVCVVSVNRQTAGRGRAGRLWESPPGGLWFSIVWPTVQPPDRYLGVPLAIGLSLIAAIEEVCGLCCSLKWPNDLLFRGRKLCGILCEMDSRQMPALIIGIGINTNNRVGRLPLELRHGAASLAEEIGAPVDNPRLLEVCLGRLTDALETFERNGLSAFEEALQKHLAWVGEGVRIEESPGQSTVGRLLGVDGLGRVLLATEKGTVPFISGDLRRMP